MNIEICEICKTNITNDQTVCAGFGGVFKSRSFCMACGKPVLVFLQTHGFLQGEKRFPTIDIGFPTIDIERV
jgi:hypothetical protein